LKIHYIHLKYGEEKPIVVDKFGYIVNGHHRYDAYKKLNIDVVPVIKVNATIEELIDKYM
jgi:ParB-like chromosome segregation protein Spo0J